MREQGRHLDIVKRNAGFSQKPVDFVLRTLRTSDLPTVVVEGEHDKQIYRWLEDLLDRPHVNILSAKGRDNLLEIFKRRGEFKRRLPVVFMADKDKWVFSGPPAEYDDIIWTSGYSIENDLYSDSNPRTLIPSHEVYEHSCKLDEAIQNFAREVAHWMAAQDRNADVDELTEICRRTITAQHELRLRGKTLFDILLDFCRARNHLELCKDVFSTVDLEKNDPPLLSRLVWEIQRKIAEKQAKLVERSFIGEALFKRLESVSDSQH